MARVQEGAGGEVLTTDDLDGTDDETSPRGALGLLGGERFHGNDGANDPTSPMDCPQRLGQRRDDGFDGFGADAEAEEVGVEAAGG